MKTIHKGFDAFIKGTFGNSGDNLFVDATGVVRRITENDFNHDGIFDIALPNSHGYTERGPVSVYKQDGKNNWQHSELPHDCSWNTIACDIDGDGYEDLLVTFAANGVTCDLECYIFWGSKDGLTQECTALKSVGAYGAAFCDLTGNGLQDLVITTSWYDHHFTGNLFKQRVYLQESPRKFRDATEEFPFEGLSIDALVCTDINNDGYPDFIFAGYKQNYTDDVYTNIFFGSKDGYSKENSMQLPCSLVTKAYAQDLNKDGFKEVILTGNGRITIYWNRNGTFSENDKKVIEIEGENAMYFKKELPLCFVDFDGDGNNEILIGTKEGVQIRRIDDLDAVWRRIDCYGCTAVTAVDLNGDGSYDIFAGRFYNDETKTYDSQSLLFHNQGDNRFDIEHTTAFDTFGVRDAKFYDLDHDGKFELYICNTITGHIQHDPEFPAFLYLGNKDFQYLKENRIDFPIITSCYGYTGSDTDNDGEVEFVASTHSTIRVFKGTENGPDPKNFQELVHPKLLRKELGGVLVGDFNHDGYLDIIMLPWVYSKNEEELNSSVYVWYGSADGYKEENRQLLPCYIATAQSVVLADINADGYQDLIYSDGDGRLGVFLGTKDGFDPDSHRLFTLKGHEDNKAFHFGVTAVDYDKDGKLEVICTSSGHYFNIPSYVYILRDWNDEEGFPADKQIRWETGATTGYVSFADMYNTGWLDMILPHYSSTETRTGPLRIIRNDQHGSFQFDDTENFIFDSSVASIPVDLTRNGYPDLFVCCHRKDKGHILDSYLLMNGPDGLDYDHPHKYLGIGPHNFTTKSQANVFDRSESEYYTSCPIKLDDDKTVHIYWVAEEPNTSKLFMRIRFDDGIWSDALENGTIIPVPRHSKIIQYQAEFYSPALCNSPRLKRVTID
ncbi:MAG: hypothetical protein HN389_08850 [Clostridia bacterium]|nr:hypothetical protein [Clostridia bacterium]